MRFDPAHFVFIRPHASEIGAVRPGEKITRLEEMHMSIDVARQNEFPVALDPAGTDWDTAFFAAGNALNFVAINDENGVLNNLAVRRVNYGTADQGNFLSKRAGRKRRSDRSEEHTSELQSQSNLVCRLLLEKKKKT